MGRARRRIGRIGQLPPPAERLDMTVTILRGLQSHGVTSVRVADVLGWLTTDPHAASVAAEIVAPPDPRRDPLTGCLPVTPGSPG